MRCASTPLKWQPEERHEAKISHEVKGTGACWCLMNNKQHKMIIDILIWPIYQHGQLL